MPTEEELVAFEGMIGYSFCDRTLLGTALKHRSAEGESNERMEFLGDAVLSQIVADFLYRTTKNEGESVLTRRRSVLTDRVALNLIGESIGIGKVLTIGISLQGRTTNKMVADAVEAVIGAAYLDGGLEAAKTVVDNVLLSKGIRDHLLSRIDWITLLKEYTDAHRLPQPEYLTFENRTEEAPTFLAWVTVNDQTGQGTGQTKKSAKTNAAKDIIARLDRS